MIIAGAGGFAKELYEILNQHGLSQNTAIYVDIPIKPNTFLPGVQVLSTQSELVSYFKNNSFDCIIGIGNPEKRYGFAQRIKELGGALKSVISDHAEIGSIEVNIGSGTAILGGTRISNSVAIGQGCIIYYNAIITHDCSIGKFVDISPGATILGNVRVGDYCQIGANSTILPGITLGENVIVGAGAVVTRDVPENSIIAGIPAKLIKHSSPLSL